MATNNSLCYSNQSDFNAYYRPGGTVLFCLGTDNGLYGGPVGRMYFEDWKTNTGYDLHSLTNEPRFWSGTGTDYLLGQSSLLLDRGLPISGMTNDFSNRPRSTNHIDIGAFQTFGRGDMDGDGSVDLVWRRNDTGANAVWIMNGTNFV